MTELRQKGLNQNSRKARQERAMAAGDAAIYEKVIQINRVAKGV